MGSITHHTSRRSAVGVTSALLILLGGLTACAVGNDESSTVALSATAASAAGAATGDVGLLESSDAPAATVSAAIAVDDGPSEVANVSLAGSGNGEPPAVPSPIGAALAIVASVAVDVADVRQAVLDIPDVVATHGGAIYDTNVAVGDPATAAATITVKVPPVGLEPLIAGLGGIGELTGRTQQTEDVAAQISDTGARIETAQASVDRVRELLATATDLDAVVKIEAELTVRETALETLLASRRNLADRVSLATLTITVTAAPQPAPVARSESRGIGHAFSTGWNAFVDVLHGFALAVAYTAPLLVLLLVGGTIALIVRRRILRQRGSIDPPAPATAI